MTDFSGRPSDARSLTPSLRLRLAWAVARRLLEGGWLFPRVLVGRPYPAPAALTRRLRERCTVGEERVRGHLVYTLAPKRNASTWHVVYTHGGAYVYPLLRAHWTIIKALIEATGATVTIPIYPLAPEHQYREAYDALEQVYRGLVARIAPERLVLCGDSAGGGLALGQALYYRDRGLPLPGHLVLFAPWLDVTMSNPEARPRERDGVPRDLDLVREYGRWWAGSADPRTPLISPLFGDLRGLPPIQLYQGTDDILLADARALRDRVAAAGGGIRLYETPGGFHVFMGATFTPEAKRVFRQVRETLGPGPA
jgi:epsilon-lactone hydrolase